MYTWRNRMHWKDGKVGESVELIERKKKYILPFDKYVQSWYLILLNEKTIQVNEQWSIERDIPNKGKGQRNWWLVLHSNQWPLGFIAIKSFCQKKNKMMRDGGGELCEQFIRLHRNIRCLHIWGAILNLRFMTFGSKHTWTVHSNPTTLLFCTGLENSG